MLRLAHWCIAMKDEQLSVYSVTASGKEEQELFRVFMEQVSPELAA